MHKIVFVLIILLFSLNIEAQNIVFPDSGHIKTGIINDSDGYVNIRQGKSTSSKVIGRIEKNEEFKFAFPQNKDEKWVLVKTNSEKVGFVYFNRIYDLRKDNCFNQTELIDQNWKKVYGGYGSRNIDSIAPNLKENKIKISYTNRAEINKFLSCALSSINLLGESKQENTIKVIQKRYITKDNIVLVLTEYSDVFEEIIGTVVSIIENEKIENYLYNSYLTTISIYALKKENGHYKLYGNLIGSPGDYYGGNFTLERINKSWVYKFQYYEFNG